MSDTDSIPLVGLLPEFAAEGWSIPDGVGYQTVYKGIVGGRLPAFRQGKSYQVNRSDKPVYAKALGLVPPAPVKPVRKASAAAVPVAA